MGMYVHMYVCVERRDICTCQHHWRITAGVLQPIELNSVSLSPDKISIILGQRESSLEKCIFHIST